MADSYVLLGSSNGEYIGFTDTSQTMVNYFESELNNIYYHTDITSENKIYTDCNHCGAPAQKHKCIYCGCNL